MELTRYLVLGLLLHLSHGALLVGSYSGASKADHDCPLKSNNADASGTQQDYYDDSFQGVPQFKNLKDSASRYHDSTVTRDLGAARTTTPYEPAYDIDQKHRSYPIFTTFHVLTLQTRSSNLYSAVTNTKSGSDILPIVDVTASTDSGFPTIPPPVDSGQPSINVATVSTQSVTSDTELPTPGSELPTHSFSGAIRPFASGQPVTIRNPSFEEVNQNGAFGTLPKRQSAAQLASTTRDWTISSCGTGSLADCFFDNYEAVDGTWAFSGRKGGVIYQDGIQLLPGARYNYTFYYKVIPVKNGTGQISTNIQLTHKIGLENAYLDNNNWTQANPPIPGPLSAVGVTIGPDWIIQSFRYSEVATCDHIPYADRILADGTLDFRMFVEDYVRIQQVEPPPGNDALSYLKNICKKSPPATTTSDYVITQTHSATSPPAIGANILGNASFENKTFLQDADFPRPFVKEYGDSVWIENGCSTLWCGLTSAVPNSDFKCHDGYYCHYWFSPTTWSQTINLTVGSTYYLSMWTRLDWIPTSEKAGSSVTQLKLEGPDAPSGSGGVVLNAAHNTATNGWVQNKELLDFSGEFARNICGATAGASAVGKKISCQVTIDTSYTGTWTAIDLAPSGLTSLRNYLDNIVIAKVI
ncbi:hypothetical protein SUNI508_06663 [Seiridium unicorne]|uniref:CBM-cenC domain-containing protein n=1 Tax=Seiridium unicorne TaxID=138068 RepID=A0ABR2V0Z1_9PEZI